MKRIFSRVVVCGALVALVGCQQGTDLASDPTPVDVEAPELAPEIAASASATASAKADVAAQRMAENAVGVGGLFRLSDTESASIVAVTNLFSAEAVDGGITVTARSTVTLDNRSLTGALPASAFPNPAAAVVPLWKASSPVCTIAGGDDEQRIVEEIGDSGDDDDAIGCHGVVPALGLSQDLETDANGSMGGVESVPAVAGDEVIPVDGDADALVEAIAFPDGWALVTIVDIENVVASRVYESVTCDIIGSALGTGGTATVLSTEELPGCG